MIWWLVGPIATIHDRLIMMVSRPYYLVGYCTLRGWIIVSYSIHKLLAKKQLHYLNCTVYNMWDGAYCHYDIVLFLKVYSLYFNWFFLFAETSCKMVRQNGKIGLDEDWLKSGIIPFKSENSATGIEYCEDRCLKNQRCIALHYLNNYCFIYYEISIIEDHANSVVSVKTCSNTPRK
jgi:hypothetical protein